MRLVFPKKWKRQWIFYLLAGLVYLYLGWGLILRQLIQHHHFESIEKQQSYRRIIQIAPRGNIYDRNGKLLAGNRPRFSIVAHLPELQREFREAYRKRVRELKQEGLEVQPNLEQANARNDIIQRYLTQINEQLGQNYKIDKKSLERHFSQNRLIPYPLVVDLSTEEFAKLIEFFPKDSPIQLQTDATRFYPYDALASHVIGYASPTTEISKEDLIGSNFKTFNARGTVGRAGVESYFDSQLRGRNGGEIWIVNPSGEQSECIFHQEVTRGNDLLLSIDVDLQKVAENALRNEIGCIVMSDIHTGEVLVLANKPNYNLNELTPFIPQSVYDKINAEGGWLNQATQGLYPTGSVFKLMTYLYLLQTHRINAESRCVCNGGIQVGNRFIRCNNHYERGELEFTRALAKSCNTFPIEYILEAPLPQYIAAIKEMGFGSKTGIELPYETSHTLVPTPEWKKAHGYSRWTPGDTANLAIGQGYLLVSPIQFNAFTASLAARRKHTQLTILHDPTHRQSMAASAEPLILSDEAYQTLLQGMIECVEYGSGRRCQIKNLTVAAKTGTAQVNDHGKKSHLAWFAAFAPAEDPQVAITVLLREPFEGRSYGGGSDAAPIAKQVLEAYFQGRNYNTHSAKMSE